MIIACILEGGPTHTIEIGCKLYRFEMHPYMGPMVVGTRGNILTNQPGPRSLFWRAVELWDRQGRRLDEDGRCVWDEPPSTKVRHIGGKHYEVVENGGSPLSRIEVVE